MSKDKTPANPVEDDLISRENKEIDYEEKEVLSIRNSDYTTVMQALYLLKNGDERMRKYEKLLFLADMSVKASKDWVAKALNEYRLNYFEEGEAKTWPIQRCLFVYNKRKERNASIKTAKTTANEVQA